MTTVKTVDNGTLTSASYFNRKHYRSLGKVLLAQVSPSIITNHSELFRNLHNRHLCQLPLRNYHLIGRHWLSSDKWNSR